MAESIHSLPLQLHASCVSIGGEGVLLLGESGSGKSDLCLRLIDAGAVLVADDRVVLERVAPGVLHARAPHALRGLLEVRGMGVMHMPYEASVTLALAVQEAGAVERLPPPQRCEYLDVSLPLLPLALLHASASAKVRLALAAQLAERMLGKPMERS